MRRHRLSLVVCPSVLLGAIIASSLGAPALAAKAAGVTTDQVRQIANEVVTHRASGLTVGRARSAADADRLGGQLPAAYQTQDIDFRLPVDYDRQTSRNYVLGGVPAGRYLVTYDITFMPVSPGQASRVSCSLYQNTPPNSQPAASGISEGLTVTGSTVLAFGNGAGTPSLGCRSDGDGFTIADHRITNYHVTGVRLDATAEGTVTEPSAP